MSDLFFRRRNLGKVLEEIESEHVTAKEKYQVVFNPVLSQSTINSIDELLVQCKFLKAKYFIKD